jgi:hypothetical protein
MRQTPVTGLRLLIQSLDQPELFQHKMLDVKEFTIKFLSKTEPPEYYYLSFHSDLLDLIVQDTTLNGTTKKMENVPMNRARTIERSSPYQIQRHCFFMLKYGHTSHI